MRTFEDSNGREWRATVEERSGPDYKGRFHLRFEEVDGTEVADLTDIRWNTHRTAERTLETMSLVELRRRLRSARGREGERVAPA